MKVIVCKKVAIVQLETCIYRINVECKRFLWYNNKIIVENGEKNMPAEYALKGYTYQQYIYMLLTAIMDAKREITMIDAETFTDGEKHNFDDICIEVRGQKYVFQTKNYPQTKYHCPGMGQ